MIYSSFLNELLIRKCFSTQILVNLHNKSYFQEKTQNDPTISLNNVQVERSSYQKHLVIILDEKLNFKQHTDIDVSKVNKGISVKKNFDTFCHGNH